MNRYIASSGGLTRWLRGLLCRWLPHRWLVNSSNDWRWCSYCGAEEQRVGAAVWKD